MKKADYILGGVLVAVASFFFYESFHFQKAIVGDNQLGEAFFPRLLSILLFLLALSLMYWTWRKGDDGRVGARLFDKSKLPLCTMLVLVLYVFLLGKLGFLVATLALNFALMVLFGAKSLAGVFVFPPALTLATYWIFAKLLLVPLPEGIFYF